MTDITRKCGNCHWWTKWRDFLATPDARKEAQSWNTIGHCAVEIRQGPAKTTVQQGLTGEDYVCIRFNERPESK